MASRKSPPSTAGARVVAGRGVERATLQPQQRQQAASQPVVLVLAAGGQQQLLGDDLGPPALDRVAHDPGQPSAVDVALDEVVLGAGRDGGEPEGAIAQTGQHDDRQRRRRLAQLGERVEAGGVGQPEVDQRAGMRRGGAGGVGDRAHPGDRPRLVLVVEQLLDEVGVTVVVLDEQHPMVLAGCRLSPGLLSGQHDDLLLHRASPLPRCFASWAQSSQPRRAGGGRPTAPATVVDSTHAPGPLPLGGRRRAAAHVSGQA